MYYSNTNNDLDVVVSTNISLSRNLAYYPFPNKMDDVQIDAATEEIINCLFKEDNLSKDNWEIALADDLDVNLKRKLIINGMISEDIANNKSNTKLIVSKDGSVLISLCVNNHIQIHLSLKGSNLESANNILTVVDNIICGEFNLAFDQKLGFLTENLTELGTGMKSSVILFLPALETAASISEMSESVAKIGLKLDKIGSENSLYLLTNCITMGITSDEAIRNLQAICNQIVDKERFYRMQLLSDSIEQEYLSTKKFLLNSVELSYKKAINLLYRFRLCSAMGVGRLSLQKVSDLIDENEINKDTLLNSQRAEQLRRYFA